MIIQCDKCATRYRLDESRVTGFGVKIRCTKCQNVFIVAPPPVEEAHIEEVLPEKGKAPAPPVRPSIKKEEKPAERPRERPVKKLLDNETLEFNFERPPGESPADTTGVKDERSPAPGITFPGLDLGFKAEFRKDESARHEEAPSGEKSHFEGMDFNFGEGVGEKAVGPSGGEKDTDEWNIAPGIKDAAGGVMKTAEEKPAGPPESEPPAAAAHGVAPLKDAQDVTAQASAYPKDETPAGPFEGMLQAPVPDRYDDSGGKEVPVSRPPARRRGVKRYIIAAAAIVMIAAAAFYFRGGAELAAGRFLTRHSTAQGEQTVRIDTIRGYFVDNRNIGRVFVIEAWIKNISDSPQDIGEIKGILYNGGGEKIKVQPVSPGRVISIEDIKNLSKDDIIKQYKDISGGTVPPRGALPVTIVFIDIPKGMAEYGIEIVRGRS